MPHLHAVLTTGAPVAAARRRVCHRTVRVWLLVWSCVLLSARAGSAQTDLQLWGNFALAGTLGSNPKAGWGLDLEMQSLVSAPEGEPAWFATATTPSAEYAVTSWLDVMGELGSTLTRQTDGINSYELTPRGGVRFYLFPRFLQSIPRPNPLDLLPHQRRLVLRDLVRVESRNIFYSGDTPTESVVRYRNRLELLYPLNRPRINSDGVRTLVVDWEWFIPLDDPTERFANRQRVRSGITYRRSSEWRYEFFYMWTKSRDTTGEPFSTSDNIISVVARKILN